MAKRCPESRYIGIAKLHDYRFQINQRGYANVLPSPGNCVEGLVYLLSLTDEARLDKSEGVPTAYQKRSLDIEVCTAAIDHVGRAVPELARQLERSEPRIVPPQASTQSMDFRRDSFSDLHPPVSQRRGSWHLGPSFARGYTKGHTTKQAWADERMDTQAGYDGPRRAGDCSLKGQATKALVYVSEDFVQDDWPRDEYIDRMNAGIVDARKLGMSDMYIGVCLRPYIKDRELLSQGSTFAQRGDPVSRSHSRRQSSTRGYRLPESKIDTGDTSYAKDNGQIRRYTVVISATLPMVLT